MPSNGFARTGTAERWQFLFVASEAVELEPLWPAANRMFARSNGRWLMPKKVSGKGGAFCWPRMERARSWRRVVWRWRLRATSWLNCRLQNWRLWSAPAFAAL